MQKVVGSNPTVETKINSDVAKLATAPDCLSGGEIGKLIGVSRNHLNCARQKPWVAVLKAPCITSPCTFESYCWSIVKYYRVSVTMRMSLVFIIKQINIMTFFTDLWAKVKAFFTVAKTKTAVEYGIEVATLLNTVVQSPIADYLSYVIPGTGEAAIVASLKARLPGILVDLNLVDSAIDTKDPNAVIAAAMATIQTKQGTIQYAILHSIAAVVSDVAANGELSWSEIVSILEDVYQEVKK